jgi:membrane associated rhomboid family serine protease
MSEIRFSRPTSFPPVVKNLIIINVLVWIAELFYDRKDDTYGFLSNKIALHAFGDPGFSPYQIVTHMFGHASYDSNHQIVFAHILFNMFTLFMFGRIMENRWGSKRFLIFYFACGLGAAAAHLLVQSILGTYVSAIGASGAIMGVMAAFAYTYPNTELYVMLIPIPIKAKWAMLGLAAIDIFGGVAGSDNIAHFAHLGGALTGIIIVMIWNKTNRKTLY